MLKREVENCFGYLTCGFLEAFLRLLSPDGSLHVRCGYDDVAHITLALYFFFSSPTPLQASLSAFVKSRLAATSALAQGGI